MERIVQTRPDLWEYERVRLKEFISQPSTHGEQDEREIRNAEGNLVARTDFTAKHPVISGSSTFFDSGKMAGSIIVRHSIRAQIIKAALFGILSSLLGCLIYFIFRTYPLEQLENTLADLQRERDKSEKTLYVIGDGVISIDDSGKILFINRVAESLVGMDSSEAVGRPLEEVYRLRQGQGTEGAEKGWILTGKGGSEHAIEEVRTPLTGTGSDASGAVIVFRDITERNRMEETARLSLEAAEQLAEEIAIIAEIGRVVGSTLDIDEVYERLAAETRKLIPFDRLTVNLHRLHEEYVKVAYTLGEKVPGRFKGDLFSLEGSMCEIIAKTGKGLYSHPIDPGEINHPLSNHYASVKAGLRSLLRVPLIYRDEVIGSLHFGLKRADAYTDRELRLAERIGAQIAGAIGSAKLFSDLKETEEALRESEGRFRAIFEQAAVGVAEIDIRTGRFCTVNRRLCEMVGRTEEELLATTFLAITHPEDLHLHQEKSRSLIAGKIRHYTLEKRYLRKDGEGIWMNVTVSPLWKPGEAPKRNIVVFEDTSERKRMKEKSDHHTRQLAMLHETSIEMMAKLNLEALLQSIARRSLELIGGTTSNVYLYRPEEDLMERVVIVGPTLIPSRTTRKRGEGMVGQTWAKGAPMLVNDYRAWPGRTRTADSYPSRALIAAPFRHGTEILGIINVMANLPHQYTQADVDILDMFATQATIAIHNAQLYDRIKLELAERKRTEEEKRDLEERLQRAEKMEALGQLAGGVAHDLNNVLGIVVGYAGMLLDDVDETSPIRSDLQNILSGGERAAAIVEDLLTLARRGVSNRKVLNLSRMVADSQGSPEFKALCSYHPSVQIRIDLEPNLLNLSGSPVHIGKTLFNLVSNGCESMPNGGLLTIGTANQYIDRPIQGYDEVREGDYVVLSVSDTGEGIPADDLKRIFEPFYTKKVMGRSGTGLGLAVVWGTVKDHNGYINVQSEEGRGSAFTLYFPVTRDEITADPAAVPVSEYMGRGESILIVDDVKGQRELAAAMLRKLNYRVSSVASGEEAVAHLQGHPADLLILDMIMDPGMDGLDTYRKLLEISPKQRAIIVSGFSESDRVNAAQALGAGAYVKKPYVSEKIGLAVKKELDRR